MHRFALFALCGLHFLTLRVEADPPAAATEFFEKRIRPILADNCQACHGARKQEAGLRLDTAEGLKKGSESGPVLVPGKPDQSKLIQAVRYAGDLQMPPEGKLSDQRIADLTTWVTDGAPWPKTGPLARDDE